MRRLALLAALALPGCVAKDEERQPLRGDRARVAIVVAQLQRATERGNFDAICNRLYTSAARLRAGGPACERLVRAQASGLRRYRIELLAVAVKGDRAAARVRTRASGRKPVDDTIELVRERGEFRIDAVTTVAPGEPQAGGGQLSARRGGRRFSRPNASEWSPRR